jgi:hypothetical protein
MSDSLSRIWWLWVPLLLLAAQFVLEAGVPPELMPAMHSEGGPHETLQFLILCGAFFIAARTALMPRLSGWLRAWGVLAAACCFYVAGEEISWGQHVLGWTTPEFWSTVNDQQETNLHNTSSWFDQKPRLLLEIGVLTGGLIVPLLRRYKPSLLPQKFAAIYPPVYLIVIALIVLAIRIIDIFGEDLFQARIFHRASEVEEVYLFYFVLLYLYVLRRRVLQGQC